MREDGLKASEDMLAADTQGFIDYFNTKKEETQVATDQYDKAKAQKLKLAGEYRLLIEQQNSYISRINKALEQLRIYYDYKLFLDQLAPQEWQDRVEKRKGEVRKLIQAKDLKNKVSKDTKGNNQASHAAAANRPEDNDVSIPNDLKELIEDPNDVYDLYFKNPDQLLEIFATLEEKNLFLIQQGQEAEQQLETKKHELKILEAEMNKEVSLLTHSLVEVEERKARTLKESKLMSGATVEEENKTIDPVSYGQIEGLVQEIYKLCITDRGDSKMGSASVL